VIDRLTIPADVRALYDDAPSGGDIGRQIAWLRKSVRSTAATEAFLHVAGQPLHAPPMPAYAETMMLLGQMSDRLGWSPELPHAALMAEWPAAIKRATDTMLRLNKRVRDLAFARNTGEIILSAARLILEEAGIIVSTEVIVAECRRIAQSTIPGHARRAAR
jgi:hypothetical protein